MRGYDDSAFGWGGHSGCGEPDDDYQPDRERDEFARLARSRAHGSGRYRVMHESNSAHCCFRATVVDYEADDVLEWGICECFDVTTAERLAALLNAAHPIEQQSVEPE